MAIDKETTAEHDQDNMVSRQEDNDAMSPDTEADKQEDMLGGITAEADNLDDIADDDDDEAILMKDNELDDALNDFDYANLSNNMDSYGEDEEENLAGEDNLEQGDIQAESKLRDAMGQYRSALSHYTESVKAVKSKNEVFSQPIYDFMTIAIVRSRNSERYAVNTVITTKMIKSTGA